MTLLYYIPGDPGRGFDLAAVRRLGLGYAFESPELTPRGVRGGPDDGNGTIVAASSDAAQVGYFPDRQTWQRISEKLLAGGVWVGFDRNNPPRPEELVRKQPLGGHWVELADQRQWLIPAARSWMEQEGQLRWLSTLPTASLLDAEGNWTEGGVVARYQRLWATAERWWDVRAGLAIAEPDSDTEETPEGGRRREFSFAELNDAATLALATNYRIEKIEAAVLGLLSTTSIVAVLDALIDWPAVIDWQKKTDAQRRAGSRTADGLPAETPATGQPSPTCGP